MKKKHILLPLRAAARVIGVKPESLQAEADAGRLPFTKIGQEYMFLLDALESAIAERANRGRAVARV